MISLRAALLVLMTAGLLGGCSSSSVPRLQLETNWDDFVRLHHHPAQRGSQWEIPASLQLKNNGKSFQYKTALRIQGWAARHYLKKSYRLYFKHKKIRSYQLFGESPGLSELDQLVLNANASDYSGLRNYLAMSLTRQLGCPAPRVGFCELWVNDTYMGLYSSVERITNRVAKQMAGRDAIDVVKAREGGADLSGKASFVHMRMEKGSPEHLLAWMKWLSRTQTSWENFKKKVDVEGLAAYLVSVVYTLDRDWGSKNYYMTLERVTGYARILRWDADATFGRAWTGALQPSKGDELAEALKANALIRRAAQYSEFRRLLLEKFEKALRGPLAASALLAQIDTLQSELEKAEKANAKVWAKDLAASFERMDKKLGPFGDHWTHQGDPDKPAWMNDIDQIRLFIKTRKATLLPQLARLREQK